MYPPPKVTPRGDGADGEDILDKIGTIPCGATGPGMNVPVNHAVATGKVGFVGQPIAVVVAESAAVAQDALDLIEMEVEDLPAVVDPEAAADPGSPVIHEEVWHQRYVPRLWSRSRTLTHPLGITDQLFQQADKVVSLKINQQRLVPMHMETRGVLANFDHSRNKLTVWASTQCRTCCAHCWRELSTCRKIACR